MNYTGEERPIFASIKKDNESLLIEPDVEDRSDEILKDGDMILLPPDASNTGKEELIVTSGDSGIRTGKFVNDGVFLVCDIKGKYLIGIIKEDN